MYTLYIPDLPWKHHLSSISSPHWATSALRKTLTMYFLCLVMAMQWSQKDAMSPSQLKQKINIESWSEHMFLLCCIQSARKKEEMKYNYILNTNKQMGLNRKERASVILWPFFRFPLPPCIIQQYYWTDCDNHNSAYVHRHV